MKKYAIYIVVVFIMTAFTAAPVFATVTPIAGVPIGLDHPVGGDDIIKTNTNASGKFSFKVKSGDYGLKLSMEDIKAKITMMDKDYAAHPQDYEINLSLTGLTESGSIFDRWGNIDEPGKRMHSDITISKKNDGILIIVPEGGGTITGILTYTKIDKPTSSKDTTKNDQDNSDTQAIPCSRGNTLFYTGAGYNFVSKNAKSDAFLNDAIGVNVSVYQPFLKRKIITFGIQINAEYAFSLSDNFPAIPNPFHVIGETSSTVALKSSGGMKPSSFKIEAGPQLNIHIGEHFVISPAFMVGASINLGLKEFSFEQTTLLSGTSYNYTLLHKTNSKPADVSLTPKLRLHYLFNDWIGIWVEANYSFLSRIRTDITTFLPLDTPIAGEYEKSQLDDGSYTTEHRTTKFSAVGVNAGLIFSLRGKKCNTVATISPDVTTRTIIKPVLPEKKDTNDNKTDICSNLKVKLIPQVDSTSYKLFITNSSGEDNDAQPQSLRIKVVNNSITSMEVIPKGWKRTPNKIPPSSTGSIFTFKTGFIPNGETDLGKVTFGKSSSGNFSVIYEWLNKEEKVICTDHENLNNKLLQPGNTGNVTLAACGNVKITPILQCAGGGMYNFTLNCLNEADPITDPSCVIVVNSVIVVGGGIPTTISTSLPGSIAPGQTIPISGQFGPATLSNLFLVTCTSPNGTIAFMPSFTLPVPPATPGVITGPQNVCSGQTGLVYSVSPVPLAVSYNWTLPSGAVITSAPGSQSVTVTMGNVPGNICVSAVNTCGQSAQSCMPISVTTVPIVSTISGNPLPCPGSSVNYSVSNISGVTYTWGFPPGWIQTAGGTTNSVTITAGTGSGNITVTPSLSCGTGTAQTLAIITTTLPVQPSVIAGNITPCQGSLQIYNVTNVSGVTYTWAFPPGWTQTPLSTTNSVTATAGASATAGNITVIPSNACGIGPARTQAITPINVPVQPGLITGSAAPCHGTSHVYSVPNVSGVIYTWVFPSGWLQTAGGTSNSVTVTAVTTAGNITVTPSNSCGNGIPRTLAVAPALSPPALPVSISGPSPVCLGQSGVAYSTPVVNGVNYTWTIPAGWAFVTAGQGTASVQVAFGTNPINVNICVKAHNICGSSAQKCKTVTYQPAPAAPIAGGGTGIQPTQFTANWTWVIGASSFKLDVSTSSTFATFVTGYQDVTIGTANAILISGLITGLQCNKHYYYRVRAVNSCGVASANSNVAMVTTGLTTIMPPTANAATGIQLTEFTANWTPVAGADRYYLQVSTNPGFTSLVPGYNNVIIWVQLNNSNSFHVTGLTSCKTYYYRLRAGSSCSSASAYSNTITVDIIQPEPHNSWTKGPGTYTFSLGPPGSGANIIACPGQSIPITMEVWGGGGCGEYGLDNPPNFGGGGGGGGGYAKTIEIATTPFVGKLIYYIEIGRGGQICYNYGIAAPLSMNGRPSSIKIGQTQLVLGASGGISGMGRFGGAGGSGATTNGQAGANGTIAQSCIGGALGPGGAGSGPNIHINDGGNGGNGGYGHFYLNTCPFDGHNSAWYTPTNGGDGRVVITW